MSQRMNLVFINKKIPQINSAQAQQIQAQQTQTRALPQVQARAPPQINFGARNGGNIFNFSNLNTNKSCKSCGG
jgi:hypothetical protein